MRIYGTASRFPITLPRFEAKWIFYPSIYVPPTHIKERQIIFKDSLPKRGTTYKNLPQSPFKLIKLHFSLILRLLKGTVSPV
jgi:hypothetical protein